MHCCSAHVVLTGSLQTSPYVRYTTPQSATLEYDTYQVRPPRAVSVRMGLCTGLSHARPDSTEHLKLTGGTLLNASTPCLRPLSNDERHTSSAIGEDRGVDCDVTLKDPGERTLLFCRRRAEVLANTKQTCEDKRQAAQEAHTHVCACHVRSAVEVLRYRG